MFELIAFDADDTLWHNLNHFTQTQERFAKLLSGYHDPQWIEERLIATERRNLGIFGYGVKGFALSMIETAIELTEGRVTGAEIRRILDFARQMLSRPVELLEHVESTVSGLSDRYALMVITKGDLFDQETKLARSGLGDLFTYVEVVSEKDPSVYRRVLDKYGIARDRFLMVGNSLKSDVFPVLEIGGQAVHIPYHTTWVHEAVPEEQVRRFRYDQLPHMGQLLPWLDGS